MGQSKVGTLGTIGGFGWLPLHLRRYRSERINLSERSAVGTRAMETSASVQTSTLPQVSLGDGRDHFLPGCVMRVG